MTIKQTFNLKLSTCNLKQFIDIKYQILTLIILLLFINATYAQKEGNTWYFGVNAGLDFNGGAPVALIDGALITNEGCAAISDGMGNLLFYTDGDTVWNKNHIPMPNGFGLMGHSSSTQSALIVQKPGSNTIYYIFTTPAQVFLDNKIGFHYSTVDLTLEGGLGDVTLKNTQLHDSITEKLTAVRHANGCDLWIIMHEWNTNGFFAYLVSNTGVNPTPVISYTGAIHTGGNIGSSPNTNAIGQLKSSPDGSKLALGIRSMGIFELFDFDYATGVVSNPISFPPISNRVYGVEFSPDGTKLYGSLGAVQQLYQYDLMAGSSIDIINSQSLIGATTAGFLGALQLAPDGKIYCALANRSYIAAVNNPNALGAACNYVDSAVSLNGKVSLLGLPTFMQSYINPQFTYANTCVGDSTLFSITDTIGVDSVSWDFGDPVSGAMNASTNLSPFHIFSASGTYNIQLTRYPGCSSVYSRTVIIDSLPNFSLGNDTLLCSGISLVLNAETPRANYLWQDSSENSSFISSSSGIYWVEVSNACGSAKDSIEIQNFPDFNLDLGNDMVLCQGQPVILDATIPGASYIWQDNSITPTYTVSFQELYWVEVTSSDGCSKRDSISINFSVPPTVNLGNDTILCNSPSLTLDATVPGANYIWQDGSGNPSFEVTSSGLYWIEVTRWGCAGSDSIYIDFKASKADFIYEEIPCTKGIQFINLSSDTSVSFWEFGDGTISQENNPSHIFQTSEQYTVTLITHPFSGCPDTAQAVIPVENDGISDTLFIPNVFTPNGDGNNDFFEIAGIDNPCINVNKLSIFNRWGLKVFETDGSQLKWDGRSNGNPLTDGTYFYVLEGKEFMKSGGVILLR